MEPRNCILARGGRKLTGSNGSPLVFVRQVTINSEFQVIVNKNLHKKRNFFTRAAPSTGGRAKVLAGAQKQIPISFSFFTGRSRCVDDEDVGPFNDADT